MRYLGAVALTLALLGAGLLTGGSARGAGAPAAIVPLVSATAGATLTQASGNTWTTTVYLDTAALCASRYSFDLVTTTDIAATAETYDGAAAPRCPAVGGPAAGQPAAGRPAAGQPAAGQPAPAVTAVLLTFTSPELAAVPQSATLAVTPPAAALAAGEAPLDVPLTVRRQVSVAEYVWKPLACGLVLAALLCAIVGLAGVPGGAGAAGAAGAAGGGGRRGSRYRAWRAGFWRAPLYASSAWTFGGSWATNFSALGALAGTVLTASGTVAGLVPGVDLGRLGLMFAVAGIFAAVAPQVFVVLNSRFSTADAAALAPIASTPTAPIALAAPTAPTAPTPPAAGSGDVAATEMWIMLAASCLTAVGIGAELGLIGWVLSADLAAGPTWARASVAVVTVLVALLFLLDGLLSIIAMTSISIVVPVTAPGAAAAPRTFRAARPSFLL